MKKLLFLILILSFAVGFIGCKSEPISSYEGNSSSTLQEDEGKSTGKLQKNEDKSSRELQNVHTLSAPSEKCPEGPRFKPNTRWVGNTIKYKIVFPLGPTGGVYIDHHDGIVQTIDSNTACQRVIDAAKKWNDAFEVEGFWIRFDRTTGSNPDITIHLGEGRPGAGGGDTGVYGDTFHLDAKGKEVDDIYFTEGTYNHNSSTDKGFLGTAIHELGHALGLAHVHAMTDCCSDVEDGASSMLSFGYPSAGDMCVLGMCLGYGLN